MKKVSANQEKESLWEKKRKKKIPTEKITAQQQQKHEKECEKKIEKANSKNLKRSGGKKMNKL